MSVMRATHIAQAVLLYVLAVHSGFASDYDTALVLASGGLLMWLMGMSNWVGETRLIITRRPW